MQYNISFLTNYLLTKNPQIVVTFRLHCQTPYEKAVTFLNFH